MMHLRVTLTALALSGSLFAVDVCGDCDGSGFVNVLDALTAAGSAAGAVSSIPGSVAACDVDSTGSITILDALVVARFSAGIPLTMGCTFAPPPPPPPGTETFSHSPPITRQWAQRAPTVAPSARGMSAMAFDSARGRTVLFGGSPDGGFSLLNDTWEYNGITWSQRVSDTTPSPRADHAMAYDAARGVTVLFGGGQLYSSGASGMETWEWDGIDWEQKFPALSPPSRAGHAMVYDVARAVTVLWGGDAPAATYSGFDESVWEYDGQTWVERAAQSGPAGGYWHGMAYDEQRETVVLLGGYHCPTLTETWEWDGDTWTEYQPPVPPALREQQVLVFDSLRNETILFGGSFTYMGNETLAWDGANWQQVSSVWAPAGRGGHSMVFDSVRNRVVLFGAGDWYTAATNDTWEY